MAGGRGFHAMLRVGEFPSAVNTLASSFNWAMVNIDIAFVTQCCFSESPPPTTELRVDGPQALEEHTVAEIVLKVVVIYDLPAGVWTFSQVGLILGPGIAEVSPPVFVNGLNIGYQVDFFVRDGGLLVAFVIRELQGES